MIENIAKAIVEEIRKKGSPYTEVVITADGVTIKETVVGLPLID